MFAIARPFMATFAVASRRFQGSWGSSISVFDVTVQCKINVERTLSVGTLGTKAAIVVARARTTRHGALLMSMQKFDADNERKSASVIGTILPMCFAGRQPK